ncbi:MAG: S-methyl-5-thioribose-1-phosphate isomerase [Acidiferrobacteraceae bacterium]|jgi:methylthioribose-1-phosphate isomerase
MSASDNQIPYDKIRAMEWRDGKLALIDQRLLPGEHVVLELETVEQVAQAITDMVVRGAPAIGITAAYGVVLAARARYGQDPQGWQKAMQADLDLLKAARPTAVNLAWAVNKMALVIATFTDAMNPEPTLLSVARGIHMDDIAANQAMGRMGAARIEPGSAVLTHCNTGALATGGYGTALGVIRAGFAAGRIQQVYADETRPWLQGARLTAWELRQEEIPVTLIADSAAAFLMKQGKVQWFIVGADRVAANGDVANKIGTYAGALAARQLGVKVMVVAPLSTVDMTTASGSEIPIESRPGEEIRACGGQAVAPSGVETWNPAFDITPAELVDILVTEGGVVEHPDREKMASLMGKKAV